MALLVPISIHRTHGLFIEHSLNLREHRVGLLEGRRKPPRATGAELDAHVVYLAPQQGSLVAGPNDLKAPCGPQPAVVPGDPIAQEKFIAQVRGHLVLKPNRLHRHAPVEFLPDLPSGAHGLGMMPGDFFAPGQIDRIVDVVQSIEVALFYFCPNPERIRPVPGFFTQNIALYSTDPGGQSLPRVS